MSNIIPRKVPSWKVKTPVRNAVNQASEKTLFFFFSVVYHLWHWSSKHLIMHRNLVQFSKEIFCVWKLPSCKIRIVELFSLLYELTGFIDELRSICHHAQKSGSYYSLNCKMEAEGNSKGWAPD